MDCGQVDNLFVPEHRELDVAVLIEKCNPLFTEFFA
jgi:hypothetical protein